MYNNMHMKSLNGLTYKWAFMQHIFIFYGYISEELDIDLYTFLIDNKKFLVVQCN